MSTNANIHVMSLRPEHSVLFGEPVLTPNSCDGKFGRHTLGHPARILRYSVALTLYQGYKKLPLRI